MSASRTTKNVDPRHFSKTCQGGELNSRPRAYESPALPLSYPGEKGAEIESCFPRVSTCGVIPSEARDLAFASSLRIVFSLARALVRVIARSLGVFASGDDSLDDWAL